MRPARIFTLGLVAATVVACSALSGIDGISVQACAPYCGLTAEGGDEGALFEAGDEPGDMPEARDDSGGGGDDGSGEPESGSSDAGDAATHDAPERDVTSSDAPEEALAEDARAHDASHDAPDDGPAKDGSTCVVYLKDAFDDNHLGWTLGNSWGIGTTCASPPTPQEGFPDPTVDHTTGVAGGVAGAYLCGDNPAKTTSSAAYLTSAPLDTSGAPSLRLSFYRWLNTDSSTYMTSTIDVYDGQKWVNLYTNPGGAGHLTTDSSWTLFDYDVTAQANAAFRVRFGYEVTSTDAYSMSLWNVDDVELATSGCP